MRGRVRLVLLFLLIALGAGPAAMQMTGGPPPSGTPQRAPTRDESGTGAIGGVVSDRVTGRPIAGALVYLGIQGRGPVGESSRQMTDLEPGDLEDAPFLESRIPSALPVTVAEGERVVRDIRIAGGI